MKTLIYLVDYYATFKGFLKYQLWKLENKHKVSINKTTYLLSEHFRMSLFIWK